MRCREELPCPAEWSDSLKFLKRKNLGVTVSYSLLEVMNSNSQELRDDWKAAMRNLPPQG